MAAVTLPIVTTYNDKGVKGAQFSLKGLVTSQLGAAVSAGALVRELGKAVTAFNEDEKAQQQLKIAVQNSTGATDLQVAGMETVWAVLYDLPGRYHWLLQYYLREQGVAMSWVGSGRMIMSLNFDDAMFDQFCERFVQAAKNMQQDGWWWTPALDQQRPIRRQVFKEMLKARWA